MILHHHVVGIKWRVAENLALEMLYFCPMTEHNHLCARRILVVDDDEAARESIGLLLGVDQHTVVEAGGGSEALERFREGRYDLVITDYLMPEMRGDQLTATIKNLAPTQPVLIVTGYFEQLAARGQMSDAVLGKPFSLHELRRAIAQQLGDGDASAGTAHLWIRNRAAKKTKVLNDILEQGGLSTGA